MQICEYLLSHFMSGQIYLFLFSPAGFVFLVFRWAASVSKCIYFEFVSERLQGWHVWNACLWCHWYADVVIGSLYDFCSSVVLVSCLLFLLCLCPAHIRVPTLSFYFLSSFLHPFIVFLLFPSMWDDLKLFTISNQWPDMTIHSLPATKWEALR